MLRKLRIKFILINMTIVVIMLGSIFGMMYVSTQNSLEAESLEMMRSAASEPMIPGIPGNRREGTILPYIRIQMSRNGEIIEASSPFYDLSDREMLIDILGIVLDEGTETGVLDDYGMRFLITENMMGRCIILADMTAERTTLSNLIQTLALTGVCAVIVFLVISVLLARWAVKPVETAWLQQKRFIADASHELKTPLTVIMTDADLLAEPECTEEDRAQLSGNILAMSVQMRGLVESMLSLARLDSGGTSGEKSLISVSEAVSEAAMMFEPVFYEKEMPFSYEIDPDIRIIGNRSGIKQLADILLDNASKYASPGGETVLKLKRTSRTHCVLELSDRGEPIPEKDLKELFTRFYRADTARSMNHSYGLGLSIAESIVNEHHGKIWAESRDGFNTFRAELPTE